MKIDIPRHSPYHGDPSSAAVSELPAMGSVLHDRAVLRTPGVINGHRCRQASGSLGG